MHSDENQTSRMIEDINKILSNNAQDSVPKTIEEKISENEPIPDQESSVSTSVPEATLEVLESKQSEYKNIFQCLCCRSKSGENKVEFDSIKEFRAHLALNHLKEYFKQYTKRQPICPYKSCSFEGDNKEVLKHYKKIHEPKTIKLPKSGKNGPGLT